jgi:hypothetical protein
MDTKPKLLFVRCTRPDLPYYIAAHLAQHVKCLSQFFDLTIIKQPADYAKLCDDHEPDLTLIESGVYVGDRSITNIGANSQIPKVGFCHSDAYCESREVFIEDMHDYGVETFFTLSASLASYTPSIADKVFVWPNAIDPEIHKNYGMPKIVPVLFTGSQAPHYPWRNSINKRIAANYPSLQCPHFGWSDQGLTSRMLCGEEYARLINAARLAPTCGTIAMDVVRKHLEIPGCGTCLLTEGTPGLEAAGFIDGVNCVYATAEDVVDRIDYLFSHPDVLEEITARGYELVHSRHTLKCRDQIYQWFSLQKELKTGEKIIQRDPFSRLQVVLSESKNSNVFKSHPGIDRILLAEGDRKLARGRYDEAEALFLRSLNYHSSPEANVRLCACHLHTGRADLAIACIAKQIDTLRVHFGMRSPDPIEWAYFIVCLVCLGNLPEAQRRANDFDDLRHPELDRVRMLVRSLMPSRPTLALSSASCRTSLHDTESPAINLSVQTIGQMLTACGHPEFVPMVPAMACIASARILPRRTPGKHALWKRSISLNRKIRSYAKRSIWRSWTRERLHKHTPSLIRRAARTISGAYGSCFEKRKLPIIIKSLIQGEGVSSAALIGAIEDEEITEAFLSNIVQNPNRPEAVIWGMPGTDLDRLCNQEERGCSIRYRICDQETFVEDRVFDLLVFNGMALPRDFHIELSGRASFIVCVNLTSPVISSVTRGLLANGAYRLHSYEPEAPTASYAILAKAANGHD